MKAYVELVQRRERDIGCDVLTHQKVRSLFYHLLPGWSTEIFLKVEWRRLHGQPHEDRHWWRLVDSCYGQGRHGVPIRRGSKVETVNSFPLLRQLPIETLSGYHISSRRIFFSLWLLIQPLYYIARNKHISVALTPFL